MKSCLRCAVFGQNTMRFPWGFDEEDTGCRDMKMELLQQVLALRCSGVTQFSVACDYGVGLYAAEQINILRENDSDLMLFCTMPYEEQAKKWAPYLRERYFDMLTKCTYMNAVSLHEQPDAQLLAYRQIIDEADMVLTVYDTDSPTTADPEGRALVYAMELQKPMLILQPVLLTVRAVNGISMGSV